MVMYDCNYNKLKHNKKCKLNKNKPNECNNNDNLDKIRVEAIIVILLMKFIKKQRIISQKFIDSLVETLASPEKPMAMTNILDKYYYMRFCIPVYDYIEVLAFLDVDNVTKYIKYVD